MAALAADLGVIRITQAGASATTLIMKSVLAFLGSSTVHGLVMLAFFRAVSRMNDLRDGRLPMLIVAGLLMVSVLGYVARRWWGERWSMPFGLGLLTAAVGMTAFVLWLSWALSHPVGTPPPFTAYMTQLLREKNAGLWVAGPVVLTSLASGFGYALGRVRPRTSATV